MNNFKKLSKQINLSVMDEVKNVKIGEIIDVFFYKHNMKMAGYAVKVKRIFGAVLFLDVQLVKKVTELNLFINGTAGLLPLSTVKKKSSLISYMQKIKGITITKYSDRIGNISDVIYSTEVGEIVGFELSDGFFEDLLNGRKHINANNDIIFGNNNIEIKNKGEQK